MRIGGLASGIDTDAIIKDMMNAQRIPLTKVTQKKQSLQWQLDSYRAVNRSLQEFSQNTYNNMIKSSSFTKKIVDVSAPNDVSIKNKNSTSDFSGTISIQQLAKGSTLQSDGLAAGAGKSADTTLTDLGITGTTITISAIDENGKMKDTRVTVKGTDTLKNVMDKITKETGVNAFYDAKSGQIALSTKNGGANADGSSEIVVTSDGNIATGLGLAGKEVALANKGQNAEFTVNGLKMSSTKNVVEVNGFEFTLKVASKTDIEFNSKPDTDAIFDNIVKFVDDYNKLIDDLNSQIRETKYRDFKPLSAEEKSAMSEKEIEQWEEKAKSGSLKNDQIISSMLSDMRSVLMSDVTGIGSKKGEGSLSHFGIGLAQGASAYKSNGKLVIDEKKLKAAIEEDPHKVHQLFSQIGTAKPGETSPDQGFAVRLRTVTDRAVKEITIRAGSATSTNQSFTLGKNLDQMDKQMVRFEARMKMVEARYYKQFNAMENAIQRANAQSAQLMSSFGG